jgi:formylglycine-generating enzyme required for sulfatase activity
VPVDQLPNAFGPPRDDASTGSVKGESGPLDAAYERRASLLAEGQATDAIDREIVALKRELREGRLLKPGDYLGDRHRLLSPLRSGGLGEVWLAYDSSLRLQVAVKVLHSQYVRDATLVGRFYRGARAMEQLAHPGIVRIVGPPRSEAGDCHYFAMELLPGGDLRDAVILGLLSVPEALERLVAAAEALQFAHDAGVIHRDVKPQNVVLDARLAAKITDFDLVMMADTTAGTRTGALGTVMYSAPEVWDRPTAATAASDVYSLGMTALFCLNRGDLSLAAWRDPRAYAAELSRGDLLDALVGALAEAPEGRTRRAGDFARQLAAGLGSISTPRPASPPVPGGGKRTAAGAWRDAVAAIADYELYGGLRIGVQKGLIPLGPSARSGLWEFAHVRSGAIPNRADGEVEPDPEMAIVLVLVPGARQMVGGQPERAPNRDDAALPEEGPVQEMTLSPYFISKHQVTRGQWHRLTGTAPSYFGRDSGVEARLSVRPVESIDWNTAQAALRASGLRLPTEAEWEVAARAGSTTPFSFGDGDASQHAWCEENARGEPQEVGRLCPNAFGLHDVHGNVWEWCEDTWHETRSGAPRDGTAWVDAGSTWRVNRGGGWRSPLTRCRSASRDGDPTVSPDWDLGVRAARGVDR